MLVYLVDAYHEEEVEVPRERKRELFCVSTAFGPFKTAILPLVKDGMLKGSRSG